MSPKPKDTKSKKAKENQGKKGRKKEIPKEKLKEASKETTVEKLSDNDIDEEEAKIEEFKSETHMLLDSLDEERVEGYKQTSEKLEGLIKEKEKDMFIYQPVGCKRCNNLGYSGRIGIFEVLEMTRSLEQIVLENPSEAEIAVEANKQGMITMKQDGIIKVLLGDTSFEEVLRVAEEK